MTDAIFRFPTEGTPLRCVRMKNGRIHETYCVTTNTGAEYVLQKINRYVFRNVDAIMRNVQAIGDYLEKQSCADAVTIRYLLTREGENYCCDADGAAWRCYRFVPNSMSLLQPETASDFYQCAIAYGRFLHALRDFPAKKLEETIPDFHNTEARFSQLRVAVNEDSMARRGTAEKDIDFAFARFEQGCLLQRIRQQGALPLRVTHNDAKVSNVLLDQKTRKAVCVIDLDTVMPGLSAYDFGDAIRSGAVIKGEDGRDPDLVSLDLDLLGAFTRGYRDACPSLTAEERQVLPLGVYTITLELGIRFLTDYLCGDRYFSASYPDHNLIRARCQFSLLSDMEKKWTDLQRIVEKEIKG